MLLCIYLFIFIDSILFVVGCDVVVMFLDGYWNITRPNMESTLMEKKNHFF